MKLKFIKMGDNRQYVRNRNNTVSLQYVTALVTRPTIQYDLLNSTIVAQKSR